MELKNSLRHAARARLAIPGGVNSPVRAFKQVDAEIRFIKAAKAAYLYDVDDNAYIDYVCGFGPIILGHSHPLVREAIIAALAYGNCYGACHELEIQMAELIKQAMPAIELLRMLNSGT